MHIEMEPKKIFFYTLSALEGGKNHETVHYNEFNSVLLKNKSIVQIVQSSSR